MAQSPHRIYGGVLIALFAVIAIQFVFATPIFEAPDEPYHFSFAHWIARRGALPNQLTSNSGAQQEGSQPPLFYAVAALVAGRFDRSELGALRQPNPHGHIGSPDGYFNRNVVLQHDPYPPDISGTRGAVYAVRLMNVLFGAIAIWGVWKTAAVASNDRREIVLLAVGLSAFNPQFAFISGAVNNDAMAAMWGSLTLWQCALIVRDGFNGKRSLLLAVLVALASLTKVSGLIFGVVAALAALLRMRRRPDWRGFVTLAAYGVLAWVLLAGWWYARNLHLYGDFTGTSTMIRWVGERPPVPFGALLIELTSLNISYWAIFGWFNVLMPALFYRFLDILLIAAAIGIGLGIRRERRAGQPVSVWLLLIFTTFAAIIALTVWTLTTHGTQGRLLFPYIAAINTLMAFGISSVRVPSRLVIVPLGMVAFLTPLGIIVPAYSPAAALVELPADTIPFYASWDDQIALIGHEPLDDTYHAGKDASVTLYWQPLAVSERDFSLYLHVIAPDASIVGQIDSFPGGGLRRTSRWQTGVIYPDTYLIRLETPVKEEIPLRLQIGWYDQKTGAELNAFDGNGKPAPFVILPMGRAVPD